MHNLIKKIQRKISKEKDVLTGLQKLSGSELNSFLLELFRLRSQAVSPAGVLQEFRNNRFVLPAKTDVMRLKETELECLKYSEENGFEAINLSPLAPFGVCSSVGFVDQNNIVSALRGTEIVSDATNMLALKIANDFQNTTDKKLLRRYATTHRHVRGQYFTNPDYSAHFSVFCLASGGFDTGNFEFEIAQLQEHIRMLYSLLNRRFTHEQLFIRFYLKNNTRKLRAFLESKQNVFWSDKEVDFQEETENNYYKSIRFKLFLKRDGYDIDLGDGGDVDWTQKLLGNKKHRLFISGIGLELVEKMAVTEK